MADAGTAGDADLSRNQTGPPDGDVVGDLHEIVDLRAGPDSGLAQKGPVDTRVGPDFHVVLDDDPSELGHLHGPFRMGNEPKAVTAQDGPPMDEDPSPDPDPGVDDDARMEDAFGPHLRVSVKDTVAHQLGTRINPHARSDIAEGSDPGRRMDLGRGVYLGRRMNALPDRRQPQPFGQDPQDGDGVWMQDPRHVRPEGLRSRGGDDDAGSCGGDGVPMAGVPQDRQVFRLRCSRFGDVGKRTGRIPDDDGIRRPGQLLGRPRWRMGGHVSTPLPGFPTGPGPGRP